MSNEELADGNEKQIVWGLLLLSEQVLPRRVPLASEETRTLPVPERIRWYLWDRSGNS
jgi:hypothetical protein